MIKRCFLMVLLVISFVFSAHECVAAAPDNAKDLNCDDLQKEITKDLDDLNYCQMKEDCIAREPLGCFILCWNLMNKKYKDDPFVLIQNKIKDFDRCPNLLCNGLCPDSLPSLDCVQNKCVPGNGKKVLDEK